MFLNRTHPAFNMELELLCSLAVEPRSLPITMFAQDFRFGSLHEVTPLLDRLESRGIFLNRSKIKGVGRGASVRRESWAQAQTLADAYWETVNG